MTTSIDKEPPEGSLGSSVGITDRVILENALRESEARFRGTFENAALGIVHLDFQTPGLLRVNERYCQMTGHTREQLLGQGGIEVIHPDDREASLGRFRALALDELGRYTAELRIVRKDGSALWVAESASVVTESANARPYAVVIVEDISTRKRLETDLRRAREIAESGNRAKDEFLANVSHEIRTPLNAILGMSELMLDTPLTADQRDLLRTTTAAANSLLGIVDDLLDFSKIEAGRLELDAADFSPQSKLADTTRALGSRARQKGLALSYQVDPKVPEVVRGDAGRLGQVLLNLVGNAIKFTAVGGAVIEVTTTPLPEAAGEVTLRFSVRDTGIGVSPEKQRAIFRAFEQEDSSTTRKYGGTGLGLTIAARLVDLMGGELTVESNPGRGSTFAFTARFGKARQSTAGRPSPPGPPPSLSRGLPLRILVADANVVNAQLIERLLGRRGHAVFIAPDGRRAMSAVQAEDFDLVLLDLHMPALDGFDVIAALRLREQSTGRHTPVVALTARSSSADRVRWLAAGMDGFLTKPLRATELWDAIAQVVARQPARPPVASSPKDAP